MDNNMYTEWYLESISLPNEKWKPVYYHLEKTNYFISNNGRVVNIKNENILKPLLVSGGFRVKIYLKDGSYVVMYIHRLVAENFIINPDPDNKIYVIRKDRNNKNNHYTNLEWSDTIKHCVGINANNNKYTEKQIRKVCKLLVLKTPIIQIAKITGVGSAVCYNIKNKTTWTHISKDYNFSK